MQLQQLRYLIAAADHGSFRTAAQKLYVSQSSLSVAIKDLEQEMGVTIFHRTSRGISLTSEGSELIEYARDIIEQADRMKARYAKDAYLSPVRFRVSSQHYSLVTQAFAKFVNGQHKDPCEFALHESYTNQIILDVSDNRSDLGIIYLSNYNESIIKRFLANNKISFTSLYIAKPHVIVHKNNPLSQCRKIEAKQLANLYKIRQEQGLESSSYYAEEPLSTLPHNKNIIVSDNSSLITLLEQTNSYAIGSGSFPSEADLVAIPLQTNEVMNIGYICKDGVQHNSYFEEFLYLLCTEISSAQGGVTPSPVVFERLKQHSSEWRNEIQ